MNDSTEILVRMDRLEKKHRRLRASFAGVLVLLGVALVSGQAGPQAKPKSTSPVFGTKAEPLRRVVAREFVLVDPHGTECGSWGVLGETPRFSLGK